MAKPRVHEIAAELGIESKQALEKLKEMGYRVLIAGDAVVQTDATVHGATVGTGHRTP